MTIREAAHHAIVFAGAVLATAVAASIVQTQINLAALTALGAPVTPGLRALTTLQDVAFFGPVMAAITAAAFLPAFAAVRLISGFVPLSGVVLHAVAGAVGLWAAFHLMGHFTPMPTLVAAARTPGGLLALCLTGTVGGALYAHACSRLPFGRPTDGASFGT